MAPMKSGCSSLIRYTHLVEKVRVEHDTGHVSLEQLARCFLFYLLSVFIFLNASGIGFLQLLPILRDLRSLPKYSWGTIAFAHIYSSLDRACRGHSRIFSCLFVLDVSVISPFLDCLIYFGCSESFLLDRFGPTSSGCFLA